MTPGDQQFMLANIWMAAAYATEGIGILFCVVVSMIYFYQAFKA